MNIFTLKKEEVSCDFHAQILKKQNAHFKKDCDKISAFTKKTSGLTNKIINMILSISDSRTFRRRTKNATYIMGQVYTFFSEEDYHAVSAAGLHMVAVPLSETYSENVLRKFRTSLFYKFLTINLSPQ